MAYDLTPHLIPSHTAILVFECQEGVIGSQSHLPGLAAAARSIRNLTAYLERNPEALSSGKTGPGGRQ